MKEIAKTALKLKLGARGLRSILEIILTDIMYEAPDMSDTKNIHITKDMIISMLDKVYNLNE